MRRLDRTLLGPSPQLVDVGERRRARWLAGLLLLMAAGFGSLDVYYLLTRQSYTPPWFGYALLGINYALVRSGRFRLAAILTVAMFPLVVFALVATGRAAAPQTTLSFLVLGILLASVLLSAGTVVVFTLLALLGIATLHAFGGAAPGADTLGPAVLVAITGGIASVGALLRQRIEQERREVLVSANAELERRVRERTAELERANAELEAFAYSASHDLRTPLRAIDGYAAMLAEDEGERLSEAARRSLAKIRSGTLRMTELVDGMLALSKVSRSSFRVEPLDLAELARELVEELRVAQPTHVVEFVCPRSCLAEGDRGLLRIALFNLLQNAWKFTQKQGSPRVELGRENGRHGEARYWVKDNGVGFEPALALELFRPFHRLHRADEFAGTGIGAAIVARVMERHGGRVWAESKLGEGAQFYFTLGGTPGSAAPSAGPDSTGSDRGESGSAT